MFRFALFIAFFVSTTSEPKSYDGSQVLLIPSEAIRLLKHQFKAGDIEVWRHNGTNKEIFVHSRVSTLVRRILDENHVMYTLLVEDIQKSINNEDLYHKILEGQRTIAEGMKMSWDRYHRTKDIYNFTDQLAVDHPKRVQVVNIGKSFNGMQLKVAIFKSGMENAKKIWLDGGIHAREWVAPAVVTYIMRELAQMNHADGSSLNRVDFYICPVLNPDGYEYSHTTDRLWRKNRRIFKGRDCRGIDLNRNFQGRWKRSKKCDVEYAGVMPFSEPETRHMTNFIKKHLENMKGFITFHSFSQVILYPYAYPFTKNSIVPNSPPYKNIVKVGESIADQMSQVDGRRYTALDINRFTEGAYGSSVDWAMDVGISYPYAIELRPDSSSDDPGFLLPPSQIIPASKEALVAIIALASAILEE